MKDFLTERNGHITHFIWNVGPYLPNREKLGELTLKLSYKHEIAGANYDCFSNGILSISFNPYFCNDKAREYIENQITSIITESHNEN